MISMIKIKLKIALFTFLFLFLTNSCSINLLDRNTIDQAFSFVRFFNEKEIKSYENLYKESPYSFLVLTLEGVDTIFIAASIENGYFLWVGPNREFIKTLNGKVVASYGLERNIKTIRSNSIKFEDGFNFNSLVELDNKELINIDALINKESSVSCNFVHPNLEKQKCNVFLEQLNSSKIKWQKKNYYFLNTSFEVIKTEQNIHPMSEPIKITFYYK